MEDEEKQRISRLESRLLSESNETNQSQQVVEAVPEEDGNADMDAFIPMSTTNYHLMQSPSQIYRIP